MSAVEVERREISVRGIVQGVGFRPFVYALAQHCRLSGVVQNDAQGVHVEVEGPRESLELFLRRIETEAPPLAVEPVESFEHELRGARQPPRIHVHRHERMQQRIVRRRGSRRVLGKWVDLV